LLSSLVISFTNIIRSLLMHSVKYSTHEKMDTVLSATMLITHTKIPVRHSTYPSRTSHLNFTTIFFAWFFNVCQSSSLVQSSILSFHLWGWVLIMI